HMVCVILVVFWFCAIGVHAAEHRVSVRVVVPGAAKAVTGLGVADFELAQGGRSVELTSAQELTVPLDIMFVVERRRWDPPDSLVTAALESVQVRLTSEDRAGLLVVDHRLKTVLHAGS